MWPANSGIPRSSCICELLTYQVTPVASRRHLDCKTSSRRTWVRTVDLHEIKSVAPNAVHIGKSVLVGKSLITVVSVNVVVQVTGWRAEW